MVVIKLLKFLFIQIQSKEEWNMREKQKNIICGLRSTQQVMTDDWPLGSCCINKKSGGYYQLNYIHVVTITFISTCFIYSDG